MCKKITNTIFGRKIVVEEGESPLNNSLIYSLDLEACNSLYHGIGFRFEDGLGTARFLDLRLPRGMGFYPSLRLRSLE